MIPFNKPGLHGKELEYIRDAVSRGHLSGGGHYTNLCHDKIVDFTRASAALLTHSCTAALEMSAILIDLKPGDEVIMPSYTFVSTANAVVLRGATPVFVDIEPNTFNIDPDKIAGAITDRTRAVFVVHYAGVICDMPKILDIADQHNLVVVEDAAQALLSSQNDQYAGSFGTMACFSFHETKNIISGEGGALTINDKKFLERAEIIREKGTNRKQFFRGAVDKYTWVDQGSSYLPSELIAAFLYAQLELAEYLNIERLKAWTEYHEALEGYEKKGLLRRPRPLGSSNHHNAHMYQILMPTREKRTKLIDEMRKAGIVTPFHYVPLHSSPAGKKFGRTHADLPVTNDVSDRLVRLPMYAGVKSDLTDILKAFEKVMAALT